MCDERQNSCSQAFISEKVHTVAVYLDYIPYPSLRPHQDEMLDAVYDVVSTGDHGVLMIDAPTGSGKTSCISAALAAAPGKIVVAVRTVSQIGVYLDEINRIWSNTRHRPTVSYLIGKQKACPLASEIWGESIYYACMRLREGSKNYMVSRLERGHNDVYDPSRDEIPDEPPGERTVCPYYLRSKEAFEINGKVYFRSSSAAVDAAERMGRRIVPVDALEKTCRGVCPYEVMSLHAKSSDIIILNYHHLFSPDFQDAIIQWLGLEADRMTVIVDEAHNLGDSVREMNTRVLTPRILELAEREINRFEKALGQAKLGEEHHDWRREGLKTARHLIPRIQRFIAAREARSKDGETLLDGELFRRYVYDGIDDIDLALSYLSDVAVAIAEMKLAESDHETLYGDIQPSLATMVLFLREVEEAEHDPSYQRKIVTTSSGERRWTRLEVTKIDPAPVIRRVVDNVNATLMLSGTLSPIDAYELYCLGEPGRARKISLPNPFPQSNRLIIAADRATTQLSARENPENRNLISGYISALIEEVPGNVAVFFTSYPMMASYRDACARFARGAGKRVFTEPRSAEDIPKILEEFFRAGRSAGAVLLGVSGGKLAEGIDYKGEALNGVAVVGLPLSVFDEIQKEVISYYTQKYGKKRGTLIAYTLPAINRGLQAAGRVIRAESERGVILLCDSRFASRGLGGVRMYLPEWVQGEMVMADPERCRLLIREKLREWGETFACSKNG